MLDIKFIRENKEIVATAIKNKNRNVDVDELLALYDKKKDLGQKIDEINRQKNEAAKSRDIEKGTKIKKDAESIIDSIF